MSTGTIVIGAIVAVVLCVILVRMLMGFFVVLVAVVALAGAAYLFLGSGVHLPKLSSAKLPAIHINTKKININTNKLGNSISKEVHSLTRPTLINPHAK
jgi:hypothetical protein